MQEITSVKKFLDSFRNKYLGTLRYFISLNLIKSKEKIF